MGTLVADPFKDHLLAVLSLHDAPKTAPLPRYQGPHDWQTDAILRAVDALMARRQPESHPPPPTPSPTPPATQLTRNGTITRRAGPPALPPAVDADFDFDFRRAPTEGSPPGTPDSYRTACDTPAALGTCNACGHRAAYVDYAESPGVVPAGGALANAANQGGLDALEELRLLKDQVCFF
ncbi:hypothetical protein FB451DRAFT_1029932 [Mycena latifolia]|nr:hypothetical protein FB451DRAFT_1029932 [Mycena latifolia]